MALRIGFLIFPGVQPLDLIGPHDIFSVFPDIEIDLVWKDLAPVNASTGLVLQPTVAMADSSDFDVFCVPGGSGVDALLGDEECLSFVRSAASSAHYLTSVCTGSLVLGAAGLLKGRRATTHWASHHLLARLGAVAVKARVVRDGNLFSGGGVTAGIDFALTILAELRGEDAAKAAQLAIEYAPAPPFDAGSPETASVPVLDMARERLAATIARREALIDAL